MRIATKFVSSMLAVALGCAFTVTSYAAAPGRRGGGINNGYGGNSYQDTHSAGTISDGSYNNNGGLAPSATVVSIKLSKTLLSLTAGSSYSLRATVKGKAPGKVVWASSDKKVATVSSSGMVTAVRAGSCTVTAKAGNKTASCKITVKATAIKSIDDVSVTTTAGTAPTLPATVTAIYTNGQKKSVAVTWDDIDSSEYASAGTFTVSGTIDGTDIEAVANVTVTDDNSVSSIDAVSVTTTVGNAPTLPSTVTAVLDDGSTESVAVTWDDIDSSEYASAGTFTVSGTVDSTDIEAVATVTVTDDEDTISSIDDVSVTTTVGTAPTLPSTVTAVLDDGSTESVAVTWDDIDSSEYASAGTFTVNGTVDGTDIEAIATVTVTA